MYCNISFTSVQAENLSVAFLLKMQAGKDTKRLPSLKWLGLMDLRLYYHFVWVIITWVNGLEFVKSSVSRNDNSEEVPRQFG